MLLDIRHPIETELNDYLALFGEVMSHGEPEIDQALSYIKGRKGKMMRPIMVLLMAKEMGGVSKRSIIAAVSLEMLHTASLIHDDVVDESHERRGQASVNRIYDNRIAVLLGDFILSRLLLTATRTGDLRIVEKVSELGGTLSEGEIYQLSNISRQEVTEAEYFRIIRHKTAALFSACAEIGAISAGASDEMVEKARLFGEYTGICFQIRDDIFDYFNDEENIGKPTGNDLLEGKFTLPAIYALNHFSDEHVNNLIVKVKNRTANLDEIGEIVDFTKKNGGIEYAQRKMHEYYDKAVTLLQDYHNEDVKTALELYVRYTIERDK